jgi:hypothetical protein
MGLTFEFFCLTFFLADQSFFPLNRHVVLVDNLPVVTQEKLSKLEVSTFPCFPPLCPFKRLFCRWFYKRSSINSVRNAHYPMGFISHLMKLLARAAGIAPSCFLFDRV